MPKVSNIFRKTVFYIHDFFCRKIDDGATLATVENKTVYSTHISEMTMFEKATKCHIHHISDNTWIIQWMLLLFLATDSGGFCIHWFLSFFYSSGKKYLPGSEQFYYQREKEAVTKKKDEKSAKLPEKIRELVNNSGKYHCQKWTRLDLYLKKSPATPAL